MLAHVMWKTTFHLSLPSTWRADKLIIFRTYHNGIYLVTGKVNSQTSKV